MLNLVNSAYIFSCERKGFQMNEHPLQSFIELVNFDQTTYALEDEIQQTEKDVESLKQKRTDLSAGLDLIKARMQDMRKEVDRAELEMKSLEQREREKKRRLDSVKNQKEHRSVLKEIESLKRKQHDYEETLLVAWNRFEVAKKEYEARLEESEQKIQELNTTVEQKQYKLTTLRADLQERLGQREEKKKHIPSEWLEKYVLMRSRVDDPVVPVIGGNCTACFYNLPPQALLELKRKKMLQCKGCYRFLYVESSER